MTHGSASQSCKPDGASSRTRIVSIFPSSPPTVTAAGPSTTRSSRAASQSASSPAEPLTPNGRSPSALRAVTSWRDQSSSPGESVGRMSNRPPAPRRFSQPGSAISKLKLGRTYFVRCPPGVRRPRQRQPSSQVPSVAIPSGRGGKVKVATALAVGSALPEAAGLPLPVPGVLQAASRRARQTAIRRTCAA